MSKSKILHFGFNNSTQLFISDTIHIQSKGMGTQNHLRNIAIHNGLGSLASPQVGQFWKAFIILKKNYLRPGKWIGYKNTQHSSYDAFLNPTIVDYSQEEVQDWEECCGYPGLKMLIKRSRKIKVMYNSQKKLDELTPELTDFQARIYQHQFDHLQAVDPLKKASKIQIIDSNLRSKHDEMIQGIFQTFLQQKINISKDKKIDQSSIELLYTKSKIFNQLRRQIAYCIIDHYRK